MAEPRLVSNKWEIVRIIGQGGMGSVYEARHTTLKIRRALKTLHRHLADDQDIVGRFLREGRNEARLEHPNIVRVYDFDSDPQFGAYLIMELIEGRDLKQYMERGALPLLEVLRIGREVAAAIEYAHGAVPPIVHRDIKPANILISDKTGTAKVTDFGIAKELSTHDTEATRTLGFVGTIRYAAPEQVRNDVEIDARVDLYSLGVVLYEILSGRKFQEGERPAEIYRRAMLDLNWQPPLVYASPPPEELADTIRWCLQGRPADRIPSASELIKQLQICARNYEDPAAPHGFTRPTGTSAVVGRELEQHLTSFGPTLNRALEGPNNALSKVVDEVAFAAATTVGRRPSGLMAPVKPWFLRLSEASAWSPAATSAAIAAALLALHVILFLVGAPMMSSESLVMRDGVRLAIFVSLGIAYAVWAPSYFARAARDTLQRLRPVLLCTDLTYGALVSALPTYRRFGSIVAAVAGASYVMLFQQLYYGGFNGFAHPNRWPDVWRFAANAAVWTIGAQAVYFVVDTVVDISAAGAAVVEVDLLDLASLNPFGRLGLRLAALTLGPLALGLLVNFDPRVPWANLLALFPFVGVAALALFAPAWGLHRRIRSIKRAELARIRAAIAGDRSQLAASLLGQDADLLRGPELIRYRDRIESGPEWPIDATMLGRLGLYLLIPVTAWVAGAMFERALGVFPR